MLQEIESEAGKFVADVTTEEGRKEIASMAYKVARTKTALDDAGKSLTEDWKKKAAVIDAQRKIVRETLDALKDKIRKPLDEFEVAEENRVNERKERIAKIECFKHTISNSTATLESAIKEIRQLLQFDWQEFAYKAETTANEVIEILQQRLDAAKKYEEDQAELARFKKEKEERERKEREEKIAQEAADKAKREAEERAKKIEQEKIEAEKRATQAEEDRKRAEEKAKRDAELAKKEAEERAKKAAADAVEKERQRVAEEERKEKEAAEKREANKRHRTKINNEIINHLKAIIDNETNLQHQAEAIVEAIAKGEVPHVSINY